MPEFITVTTFEKDNTNLVPVLWGILEFAECSRLCFEGNSPYISSSEWKMTEEKSYIELYLKFHDEPTYLAWYDMFGSVHDAYATILKKKLNEQGVDIKRYFEGTTLIDPDNTLFISEFTSKF